MRWSPGRDSGNVEDRRGAGGIGMAPMGIGGTVILLVLSLIFGRDFVSGSGEETAPPPTAGGDVPPASESPGEAKNVQLVISHGCRPFDNAGAWCSPGFWRNAQAGAWTLVGKNKTDLFNASVYNFWYGATFAADPTLETVLNNAQIYSGSPLPGTSGYPLNAFNATGAYLTDNIPGYHFDINVMMAGGSDACPIDHFGHFKE